MYFELFRPIESDPICRCSDREKAIIELETITITCSVNYSGNLVPDIKWQQDDGFAIIAGVINRTVQNKNVSSSLTVSVSENTTGSKYSSTTSFRLSDNKSPGYEYKWSTVYLDAACEFLRIFKKNRTFYNNINSLVLKAH